MALRLNVTITEEDCWKCGAKLMLISPPIDGWEYYCGQCCVLTSPSDVLRLAMANKEPGSIGIVAAVPCRLNIEGPG